MLKAKLDQRLGNFETRIDAKPKILSARVAKLVGRHEPVMPS